MYARRSSVRRAVLRRRWRIILLGLVVLPLGMFPFLPSVAEGRSEDAWRPARIEPPTGPMSVLSGSTASTQPAPVASRMDARAAADPAPTRSEPLHLQLPGDVPVRGKETFSYAAGTGPILGTSGTLRQFRVAIERGAGEDVELFAAQVEAALGDRRSWIGDGRLRLQRVPGSARHDFTVYLATRTTAGRMCQHGGVNIQVGGRPYTSCRATGRVIINLDRWRLSAPTFTSAGVPLATYRAYVVNHEVGHELGNRHEGCPRRGGPAPVMTQQTLTLRGCTPYPWPRRDGQRFTGPRV